MNERKINWKWILAKSVRLMSENEKDKKKDDEVGSSIALEEMQCYPVL